MKKFFLSLAVCVTLLISSCTSSQINKTVNNVLDAASSAANSGKPVTEAEVGEGLKAALSKGITVGADLVAKQDGYFKNPRIKIPWPQDVQKVEKTLRDVGLGSEVDKVVLSLNRAAEDAATRAKPIFISAIKQLTIRDAMNILRGNENAATEYLKKTTSGQLRNEFSPVIQTSLDNVQATKYWGDVIKQYNKIPLVKQVNPDLKGYVTDKALEGLFLMVADEEKKIRQNPVARTTELLKRVFGLLDK